MNKFSMLNDLNEDNSYKIRTDSRRYLKKLSNNIIESIKYKNINNHKDQNLNPNFYSSNLNSNIINKNESPLHEKLKYNHNPSFNYPDSSTDYIQKNNSPRDKNKNLKITNINRINNNTQQKNNDTRFPSLFEIPQEKREKLLRLFINKSKPTENMNMNTIQQTRTRKFNGLTSLEKYTKKVALRKNYVSSEKNNYTYNNTGKNKASVSYHKNTFNFFINGQKKSKNNRFVNYEKNFTYNNTIENNNNNNYKKKYTIDTENNKNSRKFLYGNDSDYKQHKPLDINLNSLGFNSPNFDRYNLKTNITTKKENEEKNDVYTSSNIYVPKKAFVTRNSSIENYDKTNDQNEEKKNNHIINTKKNAITYNKKTFNLRSFIFSNHNKNNDDNNNKKENENEKNNDDSDNNTINFEDEKLRILKEEINDISSIESRSIYDSETTENNNMKLNYFLNNINKPKIILSSDSSDNKKKTAYASPLKKERNLLKENSHSVKNIYDTQIHSNKLLNYTKKNSLHNIKINTINTIEIEIDKHKSNRNEHDKCESTPHFIFTKRKTVDTPKYISENKNNFNIGVIKDINEIEEIDTEAINKSDNSIINETINDYIENNSKEIILLNRKYKTVYQSLLHNNKLTNNLCFDFWNYFKESKFLKLLYELFPITINFSNKDNSAVIRLMINYLFSSIILVYDYYSKSKLTTDIHIILNELLNFNYKNLLLIFEYTLNQSKNNKNKNIWIENIQNIISNENNIFNNNPSTILDKIKDNNNRIFQSIKIILMNYKTPTNKISIFFNNLTVRKNYQEIDNFFKHNILIINSTYGRVLPSILLRQNKLNINKDIPYLKNDPPLNKNTLIIGLEDTIINFHLDGNSYKSKGILSLRPGVTLFFEEIKKYYEIIVFSLFDKKNADYIIDAFEGKEKYIDYRLYREHCIVRDNEFIKDLSRIGRNIEKMIIVDNLPQCFMLQKENGINIRSYWEEDKNDVVLLDLIPVLINIAKDGGDVRKGLLKYEKDIVIKID